MTIPNPLDLARLREEEITEAKLKWFGESFCHDQCTQGFTAAVQWLRDKVLRRLGGK